MLRIEQARQNGTEIHNNQYHKSNYIWTSSGQ
jgi:hypothetical protein